MVGRGREKGRFTSTVCNENRASRKITGLSYYEYVSYRYFFLNTNNPHMKVLLLVIIQSTIIQPS